jgi:hypothetical protein
MLIANEIRRLCDQRRLFELRPLDWHAPIKRPVYVSPDLNRFLTQASASNQANQDRRKLQALFDRFISGATIVIAFEQQINGTDMKRLTPRKAEVWEFKITKAPQLRVFARFALVDTVIALTGPVDRAGCNYPMEITRCQREWEKILSGYSPIYGSKVSDYISGTNVLPRGNP